MQKIGTIRLKVTVAGPSALLREAAFNQFTDKSARRAFPVDCLYDGAQSYLSHFFVCDGSFVIENGSIRFEIEESILQSRYAMELMDWARREEA